MSWWINGRFALLCALFLSVAPASGATAAEEDGILRVGIMPQFAAAKLVSIWRPIFDAVEKETGLRFTLRGAATIGEFEQQYKSGQFDFAYVNPYLVGVRNPKGYLPLVRDHENRLKGILVVPKDSPIQSVRDLQGKIVAFPAANALAGSLVIRAQLEDEFGIRVEPRFVKTHDSSYLNAAVGKVVAAGGVMLTFEQQPPEIRNSLRIIFSTKALPTTLPLVAHPRVPAEIRQRVQAALLKLGNTPEGKALLARIPIRKIGPASPADYDMLRTMRLERYEN